MALNVAKAVKRSVPTYKYQVLAKKTVDSFGDISVTIPLPAELHVDSRFLYW
jgi:hypothetical protein